MERMFKYQILIWYDGLDYTGSIWAKNEQEAKAMLYDNYSYGSKILDLWLV